MTRASASPCRPSASTTRLHIAERSAGVNQRNVSSAAAAAAIARRASSRVPAGTEPIRAPEPGLSTGIRAPLSLSTQAPSMYIDRSPTGAVRLVVGAFIGLSFRRDVRRQPASSGRIEQVDFGEVGENCNAIADAD